MAFRPDLSKGYPFLPFVFFLSVHLPQRNSCFVLGDKSLHKTRERKKPKEKTKGRMRDKALWGEHKHGAGMRLSLSKWKRGTHHCLLKIFKKIFSKKKTKRERRREDRITEGGRQTWNRIIRIGMERMRKTGSGEDGGEQDRKQESQEKVIDGGRAWSFEDCPTSVWKPSTKIATSKLNST